MHEFFLQLGYTLLCFHETLAGVREDLFQANPFPRVPRLQILSILCASSFSARRFSASSVRLIQLLQRNKCPASDARRLAAAKSRQRRSSSACGGGTAKNPLTHVLTESSLSKCFECFPTCPNHTWICMLVSRRATIVKSLLPWPS